MQAVGVRGGNPELAMPESRMVGQSLARGWRQKLAVRQKHCDRREERTWQQRMMQASSGA